MMHAVLAVVVACQAAELEVESRKREDGFDLVVRGRGAALEGRESGALRFHRRVNRADLSDGSIRGVPLEEPWTRSVPIRDGRFEHTERFKAPADVEIRLTLGDGAPESSVRARVGGAVNRIKALIRDARAAGRRLAAVRKLMPRIETVLSEGRVPGRTTRAVIAKLERELGSLREMAGTSLLSGTLHSLSSLVSDASEAAGCRGAGKPFTGLRSSLTGAPFDARHAGACLDAIESVLAREIGLVLLDEATSVKDDIASDSGRAPATRKRRWKDAIRAIESADLDFQSDGGLRYAVRMGKADRDLAAVLDLLHRYLSLTCAASVCPGIQYSDVDRAECLLGDELFRLEEFLRTRP